jgi:hypothetical protein
MPVRRFPLEEQPIRYLALPILKTFVPQVGQIPEVAGLPFFMVMALAFLISFLARHLTQYACMLHLLLSMNDISFCLECQ